MTSRKAKIRATANRHSIEFMLVGAICLVIIMAFVSLRSTPISIVEILLSAVALLAIWLGFLKSQQPYYSLTIDSKQICYIHKFGIWSLEHDNFYRAGVPSVSQELEILELNAVGIKLKDIDLFLCTLSPRLAGKLLIEQRYIFLQAVKIHCKSDNCPSEWLVEPNDYRSTSGTRYTGLIAMFANRMHNLNTLTGYDLLLPANVLDRDIWHFSILLNRWKLNPDEVVKVLLE
ncbi:hypothetical protein PSECIP111951_01967 [Pseudoalteromonas holothuriae]|uniref:DUF2982 domain-containing protein n=1 Tax=Pseudoalteromonas holothuriae TaxID=2963714 RepID=A0A9W4QUW5_9GAMM|nr:MULTISPECIES: DUF2982 domain-containing protein [unclassified Pseudoalteromonas]CAH9054323.1 hypothetical protein PSECIP111854_01350 [Pseudoalteromonas sp. CIP111854]CAH9058912.1 hypothetical protein PSECIP111951_01967 [Pseudoalteromonas sp. CIP111951]